MKTNLLSIVVTTYNEERKNDIFELLNSVRKQTYPDIEVVIVVEESITFLSAIEGHLRTLGLTYKAIFSEGIRGISYARNLGVVNASGEIIAIVDDDALLSADWAKALMETYNEHPEAIGVTGQAIPLWVNPSDSWFPKQLYWMIGCTDWRGWNSERQTNVTSGVNMSFRAETFKIARFPTSLGAGASTEGKLGFPNEDNDFAMTITGLTNRPIVYIPDVIVYHKVYPYRLHSRYIRKYAFWQGCAEARYSDMWYSRGEREFLRLRLLRELLADVTLSFFRDLTYTRETASKKAKILILVLSFLGIGYVAYKLGLHRYVARII